MKSILILILFSGLFVACSKESITPTPSTAPTTIPTPNNTPTNTSQRPKSILNNHNRTQRIDGKWNFIMSKGEFNPDTGIFSKGDLIWTFQADNTLDVEVNAFFAPSESILIHHTSTVNYSLSGNEITIDGFHFFYYFDKGQLNIISKHAGCGPWYIFERD